VGCSWQKPCRDRTTPHLTRRLIEAFARDSPRHQFDRPSISFPPVWISPPGDRSAMDGGGQFTVCWSRRFLHRIDGARTAYRCPSLIAKHGDPGGLGFWFRALLGLGCGRNKSRSRVTAAFLDIDSSPPAGAREARERLAARCAHGAHFQSSSPSLMKRPRGRFSHDMTLGGGVLTRLLSSEHGARLFIFILTLCVGVRWRLAFTEAGRRAAVAIGTRRRPTDEARLCRRSATRGSRHGSSAMALAPW